MMNVKYTLLTIEISAIETINGFIPDTGHFGFGRDLRHQVLMDLDDIMHIAREQQPALFSWLPVDRRMACEID